MRKIIIPLTIVLLLVASLQSPVICRVNPDVPIEPPQPPVNNADHPWGGDFDKPNDGGSNPPKPGSIGIPAVDFIFRVAMKPILYKFWLTTPTSTPITSVTANQGNVSVSSNRAN